MKLTTRVWAKFEAKGYPGKTQVINDVVSRVILEFAKWISSEGVYLNGNISVRIAKTETELYPAGKQADEDMQSELEAILQLAESNSEAETI